MLDASANDMFEQGNYRRRRTRRQRQCLKTGTLLGESLKVSEQQSNLNDQSMNDMSSNVDCIFNINSNNLCLNYSDRITEMHRQYLASIAPFNILFGNASLTSTTNVTSSSSPTSQSNEESNNPSLMTHNQNTPSSSLSQTPAAPPSLNGSSTSYADIEYLDFSVDTLSNSSCSSDRMLTQSPSAFTPTCSAAKMANIKTEKSFSPDLSSTTNNKSPTAFSIENIIRKD